MESRGEALRGAPAHAEYFLGLVERAEPAVRGPDQRQWLDRLEREWDNVRSVLRWLIDQGDAEALDDAAHLCWSLWHFWWARGYLAEGRRWAEQILAGADVSTLARARAAWVVSTAALDQGDYASAPPLIDECLRLFRELDDARGIARGLLVEGWAAPVKGDLDRALEAHRACADEFRRAHDEQGVILALAGLGNTATLAGDYQAAARYNEDALTLARLLRDVHSQAQVLEDLGWWRWSRATWWSLERALSRACRCALRSGAWSCCVTAWSGWPGWRSPMRRWVAPPSYSAPPRDCANGRTLACGPCGRCCSSVRWRRCARAWSVPPACSRRRGRVVGACPWPPRRGLRSTRTMRSSSPPSATYVASPPPPQVVDVLTAREQEVAQLIAQGKTSKEIADALIITERTADTHAAHIRDKLGLRSRAEIAAWAVRQGLAAARDT